MSRGIVLLAMGLTIALPHLASAQPKAAAAAKAAAGGGDGGAGASASGGADASAGVWYIVNDLPLKPPLSDGREVVLCYNLKKVDAGTLMPFILEPVEAASPPAEFLLGCAAGSASSKNKAESRACKATKTTWNPCSTIDDAHPLMVGDTLVVAMSATSFSPLKALGINVSVQQGTAFNPAPPRPSLSIAAAGGASGAAPAAAGPVVRFLRWPIKLTAEAIATIKISAIYPTPPATSTVKTETIPKAVPPAAPDSTVATITTPGPDPDQTITLLNLPLPQAHTLYYYNVTTGVVASSVRNPAYFYKTAAAATFDQNSVISDAGTVQFAPVLFLTTYLFKPMDVERQWHTSDAIPEPAIGFSLTAPASSVFVGFTSEVRRNVQIVGGLSIAKTSDLAPNGIQVDASKNTVPTVDHFHPGAFLGMTVNINFIQALFAAGGK